MSRLLAVAVLLALSACGGGSSSQPAAAPAPQVVPGAFRCPDPDAAPEVVVDDGSDVLPAGARAARLCALDNRQAWTPPSGVLTTGLDDLVALVNTQRVHRPDPDTGCGGVGAPAWSMVLRYDGGTRTITGDNGGCWDLRVGGTQRFGSRHVYDGYLASLLRQRRDSSPPEVAYPRPTCPGHLRTDDAFSPVADARRLTSAVLCGTHGTGVTRGISLTRRQVAALRRDFAGAAPRRRVRDLDGPCVRQGPDLAAAVVGRDTWGDPVTVLVECDRYRMVRPGSDRYLFATMLPSTSRMLSALVDR